MAAASSSVSSTRAPRAPSQAKTRRAARSSLDCGLPGRRDTATGLRIVDAGVVHARDDPQELLLHLIDLLQRHRRLVQLPGIQLGARDVIDHLGDLRGRQVLEDAQSGLHRVGEHADRRFGRVGLGSGIAEVGRHGRAAVAALLRAVEEIRDLGRALMICADWYGLSRSCGLLPRVWFSTKYCGLLILPMSW